MASPEVSISIRPDVQLGAARQEILRDFARLKSDAETAGAQVERPFDEAGRNIGESFGEARLKARRALDDIGGDAARSAADVSAPFDRSAVDLGDAYAKARAEVRADLLGIPDDASRAAVGIEGPFRRSAEEVEGLFARARSGIKRDFDRIESDASSGASGIEGPFRRAFDGVEAAAGRAADGAGKQLEGLGDNLDLTDVGGTIADQLTGSLKVLGPVGAAAGALLGGEIAEGIGTGFSSRRNAVDVGIRTGLDRVDVEAAGVAAGEAFSAGFGEGLRELQFEAATLQKEFDGLTLGASDAEIVKQVDLLRDKFGIELTQSVEIARRSVANGLAPDVTTALGDILITAQELPLTFEDSLDVLKEYAATFGPLNRSGAQMAQWVAEVERSGAFENVDKGADAIRELNTSLNETERVRPFIAELGLDIEKLQTAIADGRGADAFNAVFDAMIQLEDPTRRNVIAAELFKSALEDVTDKEAALIALRFDESMIDSAAAIDQATEAAERNRSGLDELKRDTSSFFSGVAEGYGRYYQTVSDGTEDVIRNIFRMEDASREATTQLDGVAGALDGVSSITASGSRNLEDFDFAADGAADAVGGVSDEVLTLSDRLDLLFGFEPDKALRRITEAGEELAEAFDQGSGSLVGLNGEIDISTESGRRLQEQMERTSDAQRGLIELEAEGQITASQLAAEQANLRDDLRRAGQAAGLTEDEIAGLIAKYLEVPNDISTDVRATGVDAATRAVENFGKAIGRIPKTRTVRINTVGPNLRAEGGPTSGPTIVGEEGFELAEYPGGRKELVGLGGPELRDFPSTTMIRSHPDTIRRLGRSIPRLAGGGTAFEETLAIIGDNPGARTDPELVTPESRMAEVFRKELGRLQTAPLVGQLVVPPGRDAAQELRNLEIVARTMNG